MKILKVIHGFPPTYNAGSEVYSLSICKELARHHQVHIFTREQNEYRLDFEVRQEKRDGLLITLINLAREKDGYQHDQVDAAFYELLREFKPDVVHVGHLNHLSTGIVEQANKLGIPIVFTLHDFWLMCPRGQFLQRNFDGKNLYQLCSGQTNKKCATNCYKMIHSCRQEDQGVDEQYWEGWIGRRMQTVKKLLPLISQFIAPSNYLLNRFVDEFELPRSKVVYLDYGFPLHYLKAVQKQSTQVFTFGYIGTHIPSKGINLLINAFSQIRVPSKLIIWGREQGQSTVALKEIAKKSIHEIEFRQEYANEQIVDTVFQHVNAIVVPSIWAENSPLVIHEAQACRIPVITANFGGMKEYVRHLENGLLFEHRDFEDLFQKMEWAINNSEEMKSLGQRGYLFSKDGNVPSIEEHCNQLKNIYQRVIDDRAK